MKSVLASGHAAHGYFEGGALFVIGDRHRSDLLPHTCRGNLVNVDGHLLGERNAGSYKHQPRGSGKQLNRLPHVTLRIVKGRHRAGVTCSNAGLIAGVPGAALYLGLR